MVLSYTKFQMAWSGKFRVGDGSPNSVYDASLIHPPTRLSNNRFRLWLAIARTI
jgi:hypothetical protein